jgi:hypothetical protein
MTDIHTRGPAFPSHGSMGEVVSEGMTLRDYFAAKAIAALISEPPTGGCASITSRHCNKNDGELEQLADVAYRVADAMLAERGYS